MEVSPPIAQAPEDIRTDSIRQLVRSYLGEYFMAGDLPAEQLLLVDDLGADSLDLLQVAHTLNDMFSIKIDAELLPQMLSVGGACDLVERLLGRADGSLRN